MIDEQKALIHAYKSLALTPQGQLILDDLKKCYGNKTSFVPGDPHATSFREGQRDVYLRFLYFIDLPLAEGAPQPKPKKRRK